MTGIISELENPRFYLTKVTSFLQIALENRVVKYAAASIHGTLQHICFIYRDGRGLRANLALRTFSPQPTSALYALDSCMSSRMHNFDSVEYVSTLLSEKILHHARSR